MESSFGGTSLKKIKQLLKKISRFFLSIITLFHPKTAHKILIQLSRTFDKRGSFFVNIQTPPKKSENYILLPELSYFKEESETAIVMQGPLMNTEEFTLETLKMYRRFYPKVTIILSTWVDQFISDKVREFLKSNNIFLIENQKPKYSGNGNINFQILSTRAGIELAEKLHIKYILKTRTDQRLYKTELIQYLLSLLEMFPIGDSKFGNWQSSRIIVNQGTLSGSLFIPFAIGDFFYFGELSDIKSIFELPLDNHEYGSRADFLNSLTEKAEMTIGNYYSITAPEVILIKKYIERNLQERVDNSVKFFWKYAKNGLITLGSSDIGLFWHKYNRTYDIGWVWNEFDATDSDFPDHYVWNFQYWVLLYSEKMKFDNSMEAYHHRPIKDIVKIKFGKNN